MVIEAQYVFNGHERWNLGWATPNYAGAFLATLLPAMWALRSLAYLASDRRGKIFKAFTLLFEALIWLALVKTYSRGALCAALAASGWWLYINRETGRTSSALKWILPRSLYIIVLLWQSGLWDRVSPTYLRADGSVSHRLELWRGALQMISISPWKGWGWGNSGAAYSNWIQPEGRTETYGTMVNSFLHAGVELGLGWTAVGVGALVFATLQFSQRSRVAGLSPTERFALRGACCIIVAWLAANLFSTLWISVALWALPATAFILPSLFINRSWVIGMRPPLIQTAVSIGALCLLMFGLGRTLPLQRGFVVKPTANGVLVQKAGSSSQTTYHIWTDKAVLGPFPGKTLRRLMELNPAINDIVVHSDSPESTIKFGQSDRVLLCGNQVSRLSELLLPAASKVVLLHPRGEISPGLLQLPQRPEAPKLSLLLPDIDEERAGTFWSDWAVNHNASVRRLPGYGLDVRSALIQVANIL